jgi:hypothetical protein
VSRRYIDADLPCVSDDRPTRAELAAEATNPIDPYSGARMVPGHFHTTPIEEAREEAYRAGRAAMHAEMMAALDDVIGEARVRGWFWFGLSTVRGCLAEIGGAK